MDHFKCYELMLRIIRDEDKLFSSISFLRPEKVSFQYCRVSSDRVLTFANPVQTGHKVIIADNREPQERVNGDENVYDESTVFPSFWSHHRSWKLLDRSRVVNNFLSAVARLHVRISLWSPLEPKISNNEYVLYTPQVCTYRRRD